MELLLDVSYPILISLFLVWFIGKNSFFRNYPFSIKLIQFGFILKLIFGLLLTTVYTYYYTDRNTADIYKYFDDSYHMYQALESNPKDYLQMLFGIGNNTPHFAVYYSKMAHWSREYDSNMFSDSHLIIRFNALLRIFSFGSIHVHTIVASFLSFIGLLQLSKLIDNRFTIHPTFLFLSIFAFPSTLFWGSGVLKEAIILFATGTLLVHFDRLIRTRKIYFISIILFVFSIVLLLYSKIYILIGLLPGIIAWSINTILNVKRKLTTYVLSYTCIILYGILATNGLQLISKKRHDFIEHSQGGTFIRRAIKHTTPDTLFIAANFHSRLVKKDSSTILLQKPCKAVKVINGKRMYPSFYVRQNSTVNYALILDYGTVGSRIEVSDLPPKITSYFAELPRSIFNVLFRPFPNEVDSLFKLLAFIENIFFTFCLYRIWKNRKLVAASNLAILAIFFTSILFSLIGFTTPIFGAILRYKCLAYPLIVPLAFIEKLKNAGHNVT